ncbi:alpha/beta hydrolase [Amycolatopsis magusensis]|uniref:alpha/beta hydrolase n=1 Tax=Amycolatopsis magusensis TaxID=882444 RepID=UPI00378805FE
MSEPELITLDGVRLDAVVHHPDPRPRRGTVIYAHGITADKDEFGTAVRVADELARSGHTVLRFSFRGHGTSGGTQRGATIAGEMLDLEAAVTYAAEELPAPLSLVASSFGAVSTLLSLPWLDDRLHRLVLLRPVLDLHRTFVEPETPWGRQHYSPEQRKLAHEQGFVLVNGTFELGRVLFEELRHHDLAHPFQASTVPVLIVQGDQDTVVPYDAARQAAATRPSCHLHTLTGAIVQ